MSIEEVEYRYNQITTPLEPEDIVEIRRIFHDAEIIRQALESLQPKKFKRIAR